MVRELGADLTIGYRDTITDMVGNAAASTVGGLLLVLWASLADSTRRQPGERLAAGGGA